MASNLHDHRRRGMFSVKLLFILPVVLMAAWMGVEISLLLRAAGQARIAADAAALAAAARYEDGADPARLDAIDAAFANPGPNGPVVLMIDEGPAGGGDLEFGDWDEDSRTFTANRDGGAAVRAIVRFTPDHPNGAAGLLFPGFFSTGFASIERSSVAVFVPRRNTTSLLVLGRGGTTLDLDGNAALTSSGGVSVASDAPRAVAILGGGSVAAPIVRIAGSLDPADEAGIEGTIAVGAEIPEDPFISIPLPRIVAEKAVPIVHDDIGVTEVKPGVHAGLRAVGGRVVLRPGLHQFAGSIQLDGNVVLELDGATIQLERGVAFAMDDAAVVTGTPATSIGKWDGRWILQRGDESDWSIAGSATVAVPGELYAPQARLSLAGSASLRCGTAMLLEVLMRDDATFECEAEIEAIAEPGVPGRARLVR